MNKAICILIRISIIIIALCGLYCCFIGYPIFSMIESGFNPAYTTNYSMQWVQFGVIIAFRLITSIPCFAVLIMAWKISSCIKKGETFSYRTKRLLKISALTLFIDLAVFAVGNVVLYFLKWNAFFKVYVILFIIGLAIATVLAIAAHYVGQAAAIREENESYI